MRLSSIVWLLWMRQNESNHQFSVGCTIINWRVYWFQLFVQIIFPISMISSLIDGKKDLKRVQIHIVFQDRRKTSFYYQGCSDFSVFSSLSSTVFLNFSIGQSCRRDLGIHLDLYFPSGPSILQWLKNNTNKTTLPSKTHALSPYCSSLPSWLWGKMTPDWYDILLNYIMLYYTTPL